MSASGAAAATAPVSLPVPLLRSLLGLLAVALAGLLLTGCGPSAPRLDLAEAREVSLTVTVSDEVSFRGREPSKSVRFGLRGTPEVSADGLTRVVTDLRWAEVIYRDGEGGEVYLATDGSRDDPEAGDVLNLARRAVIEAMVGQRMELVIDDRVASEGGGLVGLIGLEGLPGVDSAVPGIPDTVLAEARDGVMPLLATERVVEGLRAAGLGPADPELEDSLAELSRDVAVHVDGRGLTTLRSFGRPGEGADGSPTIRLAGGLNADAEYSGEPGPEPPQEVGAVRVDEVSAVVETQYHKESLRPLRGTVTIELPFAQGPVIRRSVEFLLAVSP